MPAITLKDVSKQFAASPVVDSLSFDVAKNHIVGFLGPNGAGKTTTLRMLVGLSRPTHGTIMILGQPVVFGGSAAHNKIGYLPEFPAMYRWMTGYEYLDFVGKLFALPASERATKITTLLDTVNLTDARDKRIATYSGGMKQRLGIAQALIGDPEVLILDEPVSALDPLGRKEVLTVIEKLKHTKTILFSTHILSDVDRICDDVIMINHGKLVVASSLAALKEQYATSILEVEFSADPTRITTALQQQKWVKNVVQENNVLRIWLRDSDVVAKNIPIDFLAQQKNGILRYGLTLPETEDLFVELLGNRNG